MPASLNGPSYRPASGGKPRQLIVFLHGVGADGEDLLGLAPYFAERLPDCGFVSPNAPFPFDMAPRGRQWFSLRDFSADAMLQGSRISVPILDAYLDEQLAAYGLADKDLALVGFSQGTMMALQVGLRRKHACAAIVGFSGRLIGPELLTDETTSRPPILLIHGEDDPVVPFASLEHGREALEKLGIAVKTMACPDIGHSISEAGLEAAVDYVAGAFGG